MSKQPSPNHAFTAHLTVGEVLGLTSPSQQEWARLRGLQYASLGEISYLRAFAQGIFGLAAALLYIQEASLFVLGAWLAALLLVHIRGAQIDQKLADTQTRNIKRYEFLRQAGTQVASGVLWAIPILYFVPMGSQAELIGLLLVGAIIIVTPVMFFTAPPLGVVCQSLIIGLAFVIQFALLGAFQVAILCALFTLLCLIGTIQVARMFLIARLAELNVTEKEETVSLLLREFEENEADWLWEVDPNRRLRSVSPRFAYALGGTQKDCEGMPLLEMVAGSNWQSGQFPSSLHDLAERLKQREHFSNLTVQVSIRGEERWWELSGTPVRDEYGKFIGYRGVGSDVTAERTSNERIAFMARYDTLTTLPNRLQLTEALADALKFAEQWRTRCALLMVDLDRFKAVNDSLGHQIGDKMLGHVADRLKSIMNDNQLCGRLGGDEFAIVIRDASDPELIKRLARQVIAELSEPYIVENHTLYVGASVGSAIGPRDGNSVEELMRNADLALYRAKDAGGGEHFRFEPVQHALAEERRQLEASLRKALEKQELVLHYQPVVDAKSEDIVSFEALVRWNSKEHGFVSPGKFIPLAEDTRLIVPIGTWVLKEACREATNWPGKTKVNVNVSPEQLVEPDFAQVVINTLKETGLDAERLELEVTESIFLRDASVASAALNQVMSLGCSVALDDFGTGYSSLGYLRQLKFSTIKVDRTFVQGAAQKSSESLAIVNAVVAMARSLNMTTTAEGVESAEEAALIRDLGCDKIQGFYFGRPMSSIDARKLFSRKTRASA